MGEAPRRLLLADTTAASRTAIEPLVRAEGWEIVSVDSSFQVLRTVRDASVDLILINPDLPGSGVSGADVAKTLKGATQFRHLPVLFLLYGDRPAPAAIPVEGSIVVDRWGPARIRQTIRQVLGLAEADEAEPPEPPATPPEPPETPPAVEPVARALADLVERLSQKLESQLADLLVQQERRFGEEAARRIAVEAQEFFLREGAVLIQQEIREQVRGAVEQATREVAREVVPGVAERLIADELARLRRRYGVE